MDATTTRSSDEAGERDAALERDVDRLVTDARAVRAATMSLTDNPHAAEDRFADEVDTTLMTLEFDLRTAKATLDARRAGSTDELPGTLRDVEEAARTWLDDVVLQARLGRMEARDRAEAIADRMERVRSEARRATERVSEAVGSDLDELRRVTLRGIGEIRSALSDAVQALRSTAD